MNAQPLSGTPAEQRWLHRSGPAAIDAFSLFVPVINALRPRIALDHAVPVIRRMVGQRFESDEISRVHLDDRLEQLAEVTPMDGIGGDGDVMVLCRRRSLRRFRRSGDGRRDGSQRRQCPASSNQGIFEKISASFLEPTCLRAVPVTATELLWMLYVT